MNSSTATSQWHARAQPTQFKPYRAPLTLQRVNLTAKARHNHTSSRRSAVVCCCQHRFVLYTKPDCPLCDGLKDKLQALIDRAAFMPSFLTGASLEVRDISTNEAWQDAMHLSVPVLALLDSQDQEVVLPRPQPRVPADRLQQHLQQAIQAAGISSTEQDTSSSSGTGDLPFTVIG